jgi:hypothetical protein
MAGAIKRLATGGQPDWTMRVHEYTRVHMSVHTYMKAYQSTRMRKSGVHGTFMQGDLRVNRMHEYSHA